MFPLGDAIHPCLSPSLPLQRESPVDVPKNGQTQFRASPRLQIPEPPRTSHRGSHEKTPEQSEFTNTDTLSDPVVPKANYVQSLPSLLTSKDPTWLSICFRGFLHGGKHYPFGPSAAPSCDIVTSRGIAGSESTHAMSPLFSVSLIQSFVTHIWHLRMWKIQNQ